MDEVAVVAAAAVLRRPNMEHFGPGKIRSNLYEAISIEFFAIELV